MMRSYLLLIISLYFVLIANAQSNEDVQIEIMEHYQSQSKGLKRILKVFNDTCHALYGCSDVKKLSFSSANSDELKGGIDVTAKLLIEPGYLKQYVELGEVILIVDSVKVLVRKDILMNSCLSDSIEYLGKQKFKLIHEDFEYCLLKYGVVMTMKFSCLKEADPKIYHYGAYLSKRGKEMLEKEKRKASKSGFRIWWKSLFGG